MGKNGILDGEAYWKIEAAAKKKEKEEFRKILADWLEEEEKLAGVYFGIVQGILFRDRLEHDRCDGIRLRALEEFETKKAAIDYLADCLPEEEKERSREKKAVRWAKIYIDEHLGEPISMADMAGRWNLNYSYFSRMFRQSAGSSFSRYIYERRMQEAKIRLNRGERIKDVALLVGYQETKSFSRAFRKRFGEAPSSVKNKMV